MSKKLGGMIASTEDCFSEECGEPCQLSKVRFVRASGKGGSAFVERKRSSCSSLFQEAYRLSLRKSLQLSSQSNSR